MTESLKNAQINHGIHDLKITEEDLIVEESKHKAWWARYWWLISVIPWYSMGKTELHQPKSCDGIGRIDPQKISQRYDWYHRVWQWGMVHSRERSALSKSWPLPHQYRCGIRIGDGYSEKKEKYSISKFLRLRMASRVACTASMESFTKTAMVLMRWLESLFEQSTRREKN